MAVDARAANGTDSSADGRRLNFIFHWTDVFANEVGRSEIHETRNSYRTCTVTGPSSHRHPPTQRPTPNLWPPPDGSGWSADRAPEIPQPTGYQADSTVQLGAPHGLKFSIFSLFFFPSDDDDWSVAAVLLCDQVPKVCKSPLYWLFLLIMQQYGGNLRSAANSSDAHSRPHCDSAHSGGRKKEKTSADKDGESGRPIISSRVWERRKHNQLK